MAGDQCAAISKFLVFKPELAVAVLQCYNINIPR